jgi:hypothetical protein
VRLRLVLLFAFAAGGLALTPLPRSISTSRQFVIYGTDVALRGAVADLAERTKASLLRILQKRDDWKTPIVVNLRFPEANVPETPAAELHFSQTGFGLKLQVDLTIAADVNVPSIQRELLRALLLELIYRNHSDVAPGTVYSQAPDWLLEALLATAGEEREKLAGALATAEEAKKIIPLDDFVRQNPALLDSEGRFLYRAYALALLQWLASQPGGPAHLSEYLDNLWRASNDPLADLKWQFPVLGGAHDLDGVWRAALTNFAITGKYELLSFGETQRQLEELLRIKVPEAGGSTRIFGLKDLIGAKLSVRQKRALIELGQNLQLLGSSANPILRPMVAEYQRIVQRLAAGKGAGLAVRLAHLKSERANLDRRMSAIDDYLNWFEATQLNTPSGIFSGYLKSSGEPREPERRRRDALSVYLDAIEGQFQN